MEFVVVEVFQAVGAHVQYVAKRVITTNCVAAIPVLGVFVRAIGEETIPSPI